MFVTRAQPVVVTVPRPRMRGVLLIAALVVLVVAIAVVIAMAGS